ncbi:hypothetical protein QBC33DRAFT_110270 [Phialemonium atrogriseum]|uniref:Uncharacterized protein n=1 Tax=Phialemonium atrogriseum TaxID=1093897 RepID=A0AAJ0BX86_9PEZI|nr:uncharacterized protein QBC33DRAFT_110270 [Phialemonium atrogriseum]KAK1766160.1 hypothetical protein QBC33DRAFT_110270 [Phialemonium atrogriseum]
MGSTLSVVKTLIVPALISLIIFLATTYAFIPLWQRYRSRYSQYLPLETISTQTSSLGARLQARLGRVLVPSSWRTRLHDRLVIGRAEEASDGGYDSEEGEELGEVVDGAGARGVGEQRHGVDDARRLSRDLEEGFRDDSDEEREITAPRR